MPVGLPRPSGKMVRDLHARLMSEWAPRIKLDEEFRSIIQATNPIETLEESPDRNMNPIEVHSGRAGGIIEHGNGLLMAMPSIHAEPISLSTQDTREAETMERAGARLFEQQLLANDFWVAVGRDLLSYGRAFLKSMLSMSEWTAQSGYPVRGQKESGRAYLARIRKWKDTEGKFPFIIQQVPALSILPLLDTRDNVIATIEEKLVTAKVLADDMASNEVKEALSRRTLKWWDQLTVIEYIDTEWVAYFLAGTQPRDRSVAEPVHKGLRSYTLLRAWRHGLGKHPVVMIPGIVTGETEYLTRWKSFLSDAKDAFELYDFLISRLTTMVWAYFLPSYVWRLAGTTQAFKGRERPVMKVKLGGVTTLYHDEELDVLPVPGGLPDALTLIREADDIIQKHTLEDVLFGRVTGAAPAFQVNLRINVAKSKLSNITQHMAGGLSEMLEIFLRGVEQLNEAVVIGGEKVTVSMAKKYRNRMTASIIPKSPIDRNQDIGAANMAKEFGLPWDWIVENILDIQEPATLRLMNDIREIEDSEPYRARLQQDALEQLEMLIEEEDFEDVEGVDLGNLSPEFAEALQAVIDSANEGTGIEEGAEVEIPIAPEEEAGLGRGPFPEGASAVAIQGGRALNSEAKSTHSSTGKFAGEELGVPQGGGPV